MKIPVEVKSFFPVLKDLAKLLARFDDAGVVIGGLAACLLGQSRLTADVDAVLSLDMDRLPELLEVARQCGFTPRLQGAEEFARRHHVVLLQHEASGVGVDISLGMLPFEIEAVARGTTHRLGAVTVRLPTPEDLIIMKAVANRPKDLEDIRAVLSRHPNVDRERIRRYVTEFAALLEAPELWDDIAPLLK